jgi:hypothetical protein
MIVKIFEIRDADTHIEAFALSTGASNTGQEYGLMRSGFRDGKAVILGFLDGERHSSADPYFWRDRTMQTAHLFITENFTQLSDGEVVDVRHILGETSTPCESDKFWKPEGKATNCGSE